MSRPSATRDLDPAAVLDILQRIGGAEPAADPAGDPAEPDSGAPLRQLHEGLAGLGWMHYLVPREAELVGPWPCPDRTRPLHPHVFVDAGSLHRHAERDDDVRATRAYSTRAVEWFVGLVDLLQRGASGLVLDLGEGGSVDLSHDDLGAVVTAIAREWFDQSRLAQIVLEGDRVYYYANRSDQRCAFVFDSREVAEQNLGEMQKRVSGIRVGAVRPSTLLDGLLSAGVHRVFVNPGLPDQRVYERSALEVLRALRDGKEIPAPREAGTGDEEVEDEPELEALRHSPTPGPGRPDAESRARFLEIKSLADADTRRSWVVTEFLAHDLDLWVPVHDGRIDGRPWPRIENVESADGSMTRCAHVFSNEGMARAALERAEAPGTPLLCLVGVEALRWLWSRPEGADRIVIDPNGGAGQLALTETAVPPMLFPAILGIHELAHVPKVDWADLASVPNVHGLKPEVVRALVERWSELSGPPRDGSQEPIPYGGGRYLPAFTHPDRYYEFARGSEHVPTTPQVAGTEPPFLDWVRVAAHHDGVVLDPASAAPLVLGVRELFYLHLWASTRRTPAGPQAMRALAELLGGERPLDQRAAGRIVADWPLYLGARRIGAGPDDLIAVPDTADLALFTDEAGIESFARTWRRQSGLAFELEPVPMMPRWNRNFFRLASERFSGIRIDPGAEYSPMGVHLDGKGLDGALVSLDERLRPRVPGF